MSGGDPKNTDKGFLQLPDNLLQDAAKEHVQSNVGNNHATAYHLDFVTGKRSVISIDMLRDETTPSSNNDAQSQQRVFYTRDRNMAQSGVSHRVHFISSSVASHAMKRKSVSSISSALSENRGTFFTSSNIKSFSTSADFSPVDHENIGTFSTVQYPYPLVCQFSNISSAALTTATTDQPGSSAMAAQTSFSRRNTSATTHENGVFNYEEEEDFSVKGFLFASRHICNDS